MERTRFITIALITFGVMTLVHAHQIFTMSWTMLLIPAAIIVAVHGVALISTSHRIFQAICPLISFALLMEVLLVLNASSSDTSPWPGTGSLSALVDTARSGAAVIRSGNTPITYSLPVLIVLISLVWTMAEIGETLSQRLHTCSPTLIFYLCINACIAAQKGAGSSTLFIIATCASSWLFLYAYDKGRESARAHIITVPRATHVTNAASYFIAFLALIALSSALIFPIKTLPSLAPHDMFNFFRQPVDNSTLSPLVGIKAQLTDKTVRTMFRATSTQAQYWRVSVLDDFDGEYWTAPTETQSDPETPPSNAATNVISGKVQLDNLAAEYLPTYYSTTELSTRDIEFYTNSVVRATDDSLSSYDFTATVPASDLTTEEIENSSGTYPESIRNNVLLPENFDPEITALANKLATGKSSLYEQVMSIRNYFLDSSFVYDLNVDYSSNTKSMKAFLKSKRGFCEQFASTYAAMVRSIGIPARVVVGFTPGTPDEHGVFTVTNLQAHSWVEVYLSGFGWLTVDPTPVGPLPGQAPSNIGAPVTTIPTTTVAPTQSSVPSDSTNTRPALQTREEPSSSQVPLFVTTTLVLLSAAGAIVVIRRRKKKTTSHSDRVYVVETFHEISQRILEVKPDPSFTISELVDIVPKDNETVRTFLALLTLASYAPEHDVSWQELRKAAGAARANINKSESN